ncbi:MAG TPA: hypothetical protein DG048_18860 [Pseudoalteromonas sp.]|nr:hypothetical protein [Pseudoalteromonas sp.]|tara:strand:- start:1804 stop:2025 length:222 start_codon:yes stop_codon:yes gene_type:complete
MDKIDSDQGWLTVTQAAHYLGVSERGVVAAVKLKKTGKANEELVIKKFGVRTLIKRSSLDSAQHIYTNEKFIY